jgi:hypothetical protein
MKAKRWAISVAAIAALAFGMAACTSPLGLGSSSNATAKSIVAPVTVYGSVTKVGKTTVKIDGNITSLSSVNPNTSLPWIAGAGSAVDSAVQEIDTGSLGIASYSVGQKLGPLTITKVYVNSSGEQTGIDFSSDLPILAIAMKGGNGYNVFSYDSPGAMLDTWVYTPNNASGAPAAISHMVFAWKPQVLVSADANPSFDRDWNWSIAKSNDASVGANLPNSSTYPQMMDQGSSWTVNYSVSGAASFVDHNFLVSGTITVSNPAYNKTAAIVSGVSDLIGGSISASVEGSFPVSIPAGESRSFSYSAALPDKSSFSSLWAASVDQSSIAIGNSLSGSTSFGSEPRAQTDTSIAISDSLEPAAGRTVSLPSGQASNWSYSFSYAHVISASDAGDGSAVVDVRNVASFVSGDNKDTGSAASDVYVKLHLNDVGYLRSMGYWKTHGNSAYQNHPLYDPTWDKIGGIGKSFYLSGQSWIDVMWTAPRSNAYYNLAPQYVAAKLNAATGYRPSSAVSAAISRAEYYFNQYAPATVDGWKSNDAKRQEMIAIAGTLGAFNTSMEK